MGKENKTRKNNSKRRSIFLFFMEMLLIFLVFDVISQFFAYEAFTSITNFKYGSEAIVEGLMVLAVLVVLLLSKNGYVFNKPKMKFRESVLLGAPLLILSVIFLIASVLSLDTFKVPNFINLVLYTIFIGMFEEFLCRGWIQNEFIERFGNNRKNVIASIILSSFIFGGMHFSNVAFQSVFATYVQVLLATTAGILFGAIYYKSKNIWSVVFLHAFYDFSLFIGEMNLIKDCTSINNYTLQTGLFSILINTLLGAIFIVTALKILSKTSINNLLEEKEELSSAEIKKDKSNVKFCKNIIIVLVVIFIACLFIPIEGSDEICYKYVEKKIANYEVHYQNRNVYDLNYVRRNDLPAGCNDIDNVNCILSSQQFDFKVYVNDESHLAIKNEITNQEAIIDIDFRDYTVIDNSDSFIIFISGREVGKVYYKKINKDSLDSSNNYLKDMTKGYREYDVPRIYNIGYLTLDNDNYKYPFIVSDSGEAFLIDQNDKLFVVTK